MPNHLPSGSKWTVDELQGKTVLFSGQSWFMEAEDSFGSPDVVILRVVPLRGTLLQRFVLHWLTPEEAGRICRSINGETTEFVLILDYTLPGDDQRY